MRSFPSPVKSHRFYLWWKYPKLLQHTFPSPFCTTTGRAQDLSLDSQIHSPKTHTAWSPLSQHQCLNFEPCQQPPHPPSPAGRMSVVAPPILFLGQFFQLHSHSLIHTESLQQIPLLDDLNQHLFLWLSQKEP